MMNPGKFHVVQSNGNNHVKTQWWNQVDSSFAFNVHCPGDPLLRIIYDYAIGFDSKSKFVSTSTDTQNSKTVVSLGPSIFDSLRIIRQITSRQPHRKASGNWKPFVRLTTRGVTSYKAGESSPLSGLAFSALPAVWSWSGPIQDVEVHLKTFDNLSRFATFDVLRVLADDILRIFGPNPTFNMSDTSNRTNEAIYNGLTVSSELIQYGLTIHAHTPFSSFGWMYNLRVSIRPHFMVGEGFTILLDGLQRVTKVTKANVPIEVINTGHKTFGGSLYKALEEVPYGDAVWFHKSDHSIVSAAPMLFHTQSEAFGHAFGDIHRNFESFVEAPATLQLLTDLINWPSEFASRFGSVGGAIQRALFIIKLALGGWLAFIFAIRPAYASLSDVLASVKKLPQPKYESTWSSAGKATAFAELPVGLRNFILSDIIPEDQLVRYRVTFHSEVVITVSDAYVSRVLGSFTEMLRELGILPSPRIIWALTPFTFIVDWFIPISQLIEDAENFFGTFNSDIDSVGHSVFVEFEDETGVIYNVYLRSVNTTRPLDPPSQNWLVGSGVYKAAAIPLVLLQALGR